MPRSWWKIALYLCLYAIGMQTASAVTPNKRLAQYGHSAWRTSEGFFESPPVALAQTKDGYLWIGTATGLFHFDGVRFVKFPGIGGVKLQSSTIFSLFTDKDGSLWIGTAVGLSHLRDNVLTNIESSSAAIRGIAQDDAGTIWVARANMHIPGDGALCKAVGSSLQCFTQKSGFPLPYAATIACDHQGNVWVGGSTSYVRWSPQSQTLYSPEAFKNIGQIAGFGAFNLAPNGHVLVGMVNEGQGLGLEEMVDGQPRPYGSFQGFNAEKDASTNSLRFDSHGALWVGTPHGVIRLYDGKSDTYSTADGLSGGMVRDVLEDHEGNIWIATDEGLDRLRDLPVTSFNQKEGIRIPSADTVLADETGRIWISDGFKVSSKAPGAAGFSPEDALDHMGHVNVFFQAKDSSIWVAAGEQILRYKDGKVQTIARPKDAPQHTSTYSFAEDTHGDIFALQGMEPDLWRIHDGIATRVTTSPSFPNTYSMAIDHKGILWLGLGNGQFGRLDGTKLTMFPVTNSPRTGLIRQMSVLPDDTVLGAAAGLIVYKGGKIATLGKTSGLPCDTVLSFTFDKTGNLWLATLCGKMEVTKVDWERWRQDPKAMVNPLVLSVLDGNRVTPAATVHAADVAPDGKVWFATGSDLQMVDPSDLATNRVIPPVQIEGMVVDGTTLALDKFPHLPPLTRQIQIDYTATSLSVPQRVLFRYKLEGHDKEWQEAGNRRQAFYNDLKPGTYRFTVLASNNSGFWNEVGSSAEFTVAPAWFQTRWFLGLCTVLVALLLYGFYLLRVNKIQKRLQMRYDARLEERTRLARDLHDTLLQTIQGTKLVAEEALHGGDDPKHLQSVVAKIYEWLSQAVVEGRAALTALRSESDPSELANRLRHAAEECSEASGITLKFELVGNPMELANDVDEEVFRIGYEAIRNACAHSGGRVLSVQLRYGKKLMLRVKDDGSGFDPEDQSNRVSGHYGVEGMRERTKQLGGTLTVVSSSGAGTEVLLSAPIKM